MRLADLAIFGDGVRFGRRALNEIGRRRFIWRRRHYLALPVCGLLALLAGQLVVMAVDPFSLYPWSRTRPVLEKDYSIGLGPYLFRVVARGDYDTVMIGGSTAMNFTPGDMRAKLSGTRAAVNLSYDDPRPADMGVVFDEIARIEKVRRVLLAFDFIFALPNNMRREWFPFWLYDGDPTEQIFVFDKVAIELTLRQIIDQPLSIPRWSFAQFRQKLDYAYDHWRSPASIAQIRATIEAKRALLAESSGLSCRDMPAIEQRLAPFAAALNAQGKRLDVIIPPYALNRYHEQLARSKVSFAPRGSLDKAIVMRRCLVDALSNIEGARVFAFDGDKWLVEDLANYYNAGHVYKMELYRYMLADESASGPHRFVYQLFLRRHRSCRQPG